MARLRLFRTDVSVCLCRLQIQAACLSPPRRTPERVPAEAFGSDTREGKRSMKSVGQDNLGVRRTLDVDGKTYHYFSIPEAAKQLGDVSRLPVSLKVLLENVLRFEDNRSYKIDDAKSVIAWTETGSSTREVPFKPARILMQDFTGVPAVGDLAAMRDGITALNGDPQKVNPLVPVDLVIDHSVMVDVSGTA